MLFVCVEIPWFGSCTALQWPTLSKISVSACSVVCVGACARERTSSGSFKQTCHVGRRCCQTEDKSENVNWIRRNVCQTFWRWPLHCDYRHLIFMRAYLPAETMPNWLLLLECVGKRFPCDKNPNDVTAMWHYEHVNIRHPRVLCDSVTGQFNKRKVILVSPDTGPRAWPPWCHEAVFTLRSGFA